MAGALGQRVSRRIRIAGLHGAPPASVARRLTVNSRRNDFPPPFHTVRTRIPADDRGALRRWIAIDRGVKCKAPYRTCAGLPDGLPC